MKLAILAPEFVPTWGGVGIYTENLVRELSTDPTLQIHVITPKRGRNYNRGEVQESFSDNVHIHNVTTANDTFFYNFKFQAALLSALRKLHKKIGFDLIHSMNIVQMPDVYARMLPWNIPFIATAHTTIETQFDYDLNFREFVRHNTPVEMLSKLSYPYIKLMQKIYVHSSDHIIAVSNYVKKRLPEDRSTVIHNGVDAKKFSPGKGTMLNHIKKPKILFCGRLLYMKGIHVLLDAAQELVKKEDIHFVFAGQGDIKTLSRILPEQTTFLGHVPYSQIDELYRSVDVFVLPSFTESFPYTLLEAMASGLPVVASAVGGIPEMVEHEKTGLLISDLNPINLKMTLQRVLRDKRLARSLSANGRKLVEKEYTTSRMAASTKKIYGQVMVHG